MIVGKVGRSCSEIVSTWKFCSRDGGEMVEEGEGEVKDICVCTFVPSVLV